LRLRRYRFCGADLFRLGWHSNRAALAASDYDQTPDCDNEYRRGGA
jgi:hypothetical protein